MSDMKAAFENGLKKVYRLMVDKLFEEKYSEIGRWGRCLNTNMIGVLTRDGFWDPYYNRPNTLSYIAEYFFDEMTNINKKCFYHFWNPVYYQANMRIMYIFMKENFYTYFIDESSEKYQEVNFILKRAWFNGCVSSIVAIFAIKKAFKNIKSLKYGFSVGDVEDMVDGVDISIKLLNGETINFQVKSGSVIISFTDYTFLKSSVNNWNYPNCKYFIFSKIKYEEEKTKCIIFENRDSINKREKIIETNSIIYNETLDMEIPEIINEIGQLCLSNKIDIELSNDGDINTIKGDKNGVFLNLVDFDDTSLLNSLKEKLKELQDLLQ